MATLVLAAAGGALGGAIGGSFLGVSSAVIGKAVGATLGAVVDQQLFGSGSEAIEIGRRDRLRLTGSREGAPMARVWGRMRLGGQMIWSSGFSETVTTTGGGKGVTPSVPEQRQYAYSVSIAVAICEGTVSRIARIWADGQAVDQSTLNLRIYPGDEVQLPDALIAASVPEGEAPAFRGTAYVVIEDLDLTPYGNRIPQFTFEVMRRPEGAEDDPIAGVQGVALVPGTGEYSLATERVGFEIDKAEAQVSNVNNDEGRTDVEVALDNLVTEVPACQAVSLVVSWFGNDLRSGSCVVEPRVEQALRDGDTIPWVVSGLSRGAANPVGYVEGRPGFGGTPADETVVQAIQALNAREQAVMFYPFLLMDIRAGNGLPDPWGGAEQAPVPWRGRITASVAPGLPGSPDQTAAAGAEVAAFFGAAQVSDFAIDGEAVVYSGPVEWSYRRFILHYAHLCAAAGGVDAFCVGTEMRSLTQLRDGPASFPAVAALRALAADVRAVLGPDCKISYAADWSEYFGYHPSDGSGDHFFHLDPFWADPNVDFVGIDNYMPLSDWREGTEHADASYGSIYDLDYLSGNVEGGEGYDWYYASTEGRAAQVRLPITDGAHDEPWVFRYKDIRNWWGRHHWNRTGGVKDPAPTEWVPESKPIWFTEYGCPAVDKGTNQPNVFVDPLSSENALPYYSTGGQDRFIQQRYLLAVQGYWAEEANNPLSRAYDGRMVDMSRAFVWACDARPWPAFPQRLEVWADGHNFALGHWISGRTHLVALRDVVREICARAGLDAVGVSRLDGVLAGYSVEQTEGARGSLQPLMLAYGFDAFEREGALVFRTRSGEPARALEPDLLAVEGDEALRYEMARLPEVEMPGRVRVSYVHPEKDYQSVTAEAQLPGAEALYTSGSETGVALSHAEATAVAERWLSETQVGRDRVRFALPRSDMDLGPGDVVALTLDDGEGVFRIDRVEEMATRRIEAVRVEADVYRRAPVVPELVLGPGTNRLGQPYAEVLDLPLLSGTEDPVSPYVAAAQVPWPGAQSVFSATGAQGFQYMGAVTAPSVVGTTLTGLSRALPGIWAEQSVDVSVSEERLLARADLDVLNGANLAAIRDPGAVDWEVIQFRSAELVAPKVYRLSGLLRGQVGTEWLIADLLPAGADFVLLDGAAVQITIGLDTLGLERQFRVGPAERPVDDPRYRPLSMTPEGVGLRPYAPVHGAAARGPGGAIDLSWVRRSRIGGDSWMQTEVPLGEVRERYQIRVLLNDVEVRAEESASTSYEYSAAKQAADGVVGPVSFTVAQISDLVGAGPSLRIDFDG